MRWRTYREACVLILRGVTFGTAIRVAAVVGTVLCIANEGSTIVGGHATLTTWLRIAVNYVVPYIVTSIGYLAPFRQRDEGMPHR